MSIELSGAELDAAVARALGETVVLAELGWAMMVEFPDGKMVPLEPPRYSSMWHIGGPIIESEGIALDRWPGRDAEYTWRAAIAATTVNACQYGPTPLIAAMRAYVASRA